MKTCVSSLSRALAFKRKMSKNTGWGGTNLFTWTTCTTADSKRFCTDSVLAGSPRFGLRETDMRRRPNGHHLCLVLPVLGPSASDLCYGFTIRLRPWLTRKAGHEATKAVADLHSQGLCHGDVTTSNIFFGLSGFDSLDEADIYNLFEPPVTGELETEAGDIPGPEAPRNSITDQIKLVDFDQCFLASSPPQKMLGTPLEFLAPEFAAGLPASPASDLMKYIVQTLGDMPQDWEEILWDDDGQPTKDSSKGESLEKLEGKRPLKNLVYQIWDEPDGRVVQTGTPRGKNGDCDKYEEERRKPFPPCFSDMVWKPTAVQVNNVYLKGFNREWKPLLEAMPKIPEHEADLLFDLLSKIFVYDPEKRPTAQEVLSHPWFHIDGR
ncbi:kinase-like domain-containing protein [Lasiosphaeria miniovina]|uniref:EKC/KEOPS complex subunit BUD32 n=1 Tax=Lasiosphaeria miniovina TaxID=1954250 RepID=A0AA40A040_9PEZI|nr:kinase-like domain-containing protein [Lasiosphaeria miniovina]KAK0706813.1 kinase-like domain-containing protein [Lasiosphaeria miniovina]